MTLLAPFSKRARDAAPMAADRPLPLWRGLAIPFFLFGLTGCGPEGSENKDGAERTATATISPVDRVMFDTQVMAKFDAPWAMTFLPGTPYALISEKGGALKLWTEEGPEDSRMRDVAGLPEIFHAGQGGFGDVVAGPDYARNGMIYLSWVEAGKNGTSGAVVGRAKLDLGDAARPRLKGLKILWRQQPKTDGHGHFSHRIAFSPDGQYMFITSGDRQKMAPAQDLSGNLGKIVRLYPDGRVPADNPYAGKPGAAPQIWSSGHRNMLGLSFDGQGQLWAIEMGPKGGDELNLVQRGGNYGWPLRSNGSHYDDSDIPDHEPYQAVEETAAPTADAAAKAGPPQSAGPALPTPASPAATPATTPAAISPTYNAPALFWTPSISPAGLMAYNGALFPQWRGSLFIGAMSGKALIRVTLNGRKAEKADQWPMDARIREVEQGPDGAIWLLEDGGKGSGGRLLKLVPPRR